MNILDAKRDPKIFGEHFRHSASWLVWEVFLCALFALPMTAEQLLIYQRHTGRATPPTSPFREAWLVCGRRSGKSFMLAMIAIFLAVFKDWRPFLGPGEIGTIMVIAADRKQCRTIMRFALGLLKAAPMLKRQIENVTRESITLKNDIIIEIFTASQKSTRGYTICCALLDEIAKFPTDDNAAEQDAEIIAAVKPGMATVPTSVMLCASSPYSRKGVMWQAFDQHYAKDNDPVLVWKATTREMNPTVPQSFIDEQLAADLPRNTAEYLAEFRGDLEFVFSLERVRVCVPDKIFERTPKSGVSYSAFVDPSGGSQDSMTLAIAHLERSREVVVLDFLKEIKAPLSPEAAVADFAAVLKSYRLASTIGDKYGSGWVKEQFARFGITYKAEAEPKSILYGSLLAAINSRRVDLLDSPRLVGQLVGLERRTARGGRDSIDHAPGGHDDVCNAVAGVVATILAKGVPPSYAGWCDRTDDDPDGAKAFRAARLANYINSFDPNHGGGGRWR